MPTINTNTLNFSPTKDDKQTHLSLMNILAQYFSARHFAVFLPQLTKSLTGRFLVRAMHAVVAGHFGKILRLASVTLLKLRNRLASIAMHPETFCNGAPVVLWADDEE